jgi:hypothetical protein
VQNLNVNINTDKCNLQGLKQIFFHYNFKFYSGDQIKKNEMGRACGTYGRQERCIQGFWWGDLRKRDHLEDLGVNRRIILKWI